ncbi:GRAM domain-containing protein [Algoriphagus sp. D3-2-R+10]|uniref:GRAM domain-containing protein n=1 Tax=Algoriphagus aurantiacus TaxID=3103948 RepID=UPI002B3D6132|nr:GRAM domain-containing protein [Algoriphagus sp. D3-2-R+10]MEB2777704.1 GRAM domain-containing protein [Algoriphagus sp. D3-2-R+10]
MKTEMIQMNWKKRVGLAVLLGGTFMVGLFLIDFLLEEKLYNWKSLVFQGIFFGVIMVISFPYLFGKFAISLGKNINPELDPDEEIETEGPANLFRGKEAVGGKLFLTNEKLIFKSHKLNIRTGQSDIPFDTIIDIQEQKTEKLTDNGLRVKTVDGREYDFVVDDRKSWMEKLSKKLN